MGLRKVLFIILSLMAFAVLTLASQSVTNNLYVQNMTYSSMFCNHDGSCFNATNISQGGGSFTNGTDINVSNILVEGNITLFNESCVDFGDDISICRDDNIMDFTVK